MLFVSLIGGIIGSLIGALAAAFIVQLSVRIVQKEKPTYWNAYKVAAVAAVSGNLIGFGAGLAFGNASTVPLVFLVILIQIISYNQLIELPSGASMGIGASILAFVFQIAIGITVVAVLFSIASAFF